MLEKVFDNINEEVFPTPDISKIMLLEDEYVKGGMIYCKKCNTPRLLVYKNHCVRCACECQDAEYEDNKLKKEEREKQEMIDKMKISSRISKRFRDVSFENTESVDNEEFKTAFARCQRYCGAYGECFKRGLGIYIYGDKGTGKTHLTACMANYLCLKEHTVLFTSFADIAQKLKDMFRTKETESTFINAVIYAGFLFLDDIGTEKMVDKEGGDTWLQDRIYYILNKRYCAKKPTIFTSNYSLQELSKDRGYNVRIVDRIAEMSSAVIKITGKSYRLKKRSEEELPF